MVTLDDVIRGGFFTVTGPNGVSHCYEVSPVVGKGRTKSRWFVRLATEHESFYIGEMCPATGAVSLTKASRYSEQDYLYRLGDRVFRAIVNGRTAAMKQHGYSVRPGTPNDAHEETSAPLPTSDVFTPRSVKIGSLYHFDYDIHGERFTMDYPLLYSRAIQTSESCYYFEGSQVPYPMLDEMTTAGCTWNLVRTHDDEVEGLLRRAEQQIVKKLSDKEASLQASLESAYADYATDIADETISTKKARKRYDARIKAAIRSADKLVECYAESAKRYGLRIDLDGVRAASAAMADKAKARAVAYGKAAQQVQGTIFEQAASDGDMPVEVLADVLTDAGNDTAAAELMNVFSGDYDLETGGEV